MLLIFDLDGTLVDSKAGILSSLSQALFKITGEKKVISKLPIGPPISEMTKKILPDATPEIIAAVVAQFRSEYDERGWKEYCLYPTVQETLAKLSQTHTLSIATNKPEKPTEKILKNSGLKPFFRDVFCHGSTNFTDKKEMLRLLVTQSSQTAIMIGDSLDDLAAAKYNDIPFIYCSYGYGVIPPPQIKCSITKFKTLLLTF